MFSDWWAEELHWGAWRGAVTTENSNSESFKAFIVSLFQGLSVSSAKLSLQLIQKYWCGWGIYTRWLFLIYLQLMLWSWVVCFLSGRHRLREASAVSVSRERELEAEPERDTGPPAAALHHPFPVQQHAHQGKRHRTRVDEHRFTHTSG